MKKHFTGFSRIFSFTFSQHIRSKGYKNATIVIALLCLLLPAAIMGLVEYLDDGEAPQSVEETQAADLSALSTVISVDLCYEQALDLTALPLFVQQAGGRQLAVVDMGADLTAAGEAAAGSEDVYKRQGNGLRLGSGAVPGRPVPDLSLIHIFRAGILKTESRRTDCLPERGLSSCSWLYVRFQPVAPGQPGLDRRYCDRYPDCAR